MNRKQASIGALIATTVFASGWIGGSQSASGPNTEPLTAQSQVVADTELVQPQSIAYGVGLEAQCNGTPVVCVPSYLWTPTPIVPIGSPSAAASSTRTPTARPTATPTRASATPTPISTATFTATPTPTNASACALYPCFTQVDFTYRVVRRVALCFTAEPCGSGEFNADRYRFRDVGEIVAVKCLYEVTRGGNLWANEHSCDDNPNGRWSAVKYNSITYMEFVED